MLYRSTKHLSDPNLKKETSTRQKMLAINHLAWPREADYGNEAQFGVKYTTY